LNTKAATRWPASTPASSTRARVITSWRRGRMVSWRSGPTYAPHRCHPPRSRAPGPHPHRRPDERPDPLRQRRAPIRRAATIDARLTIQLSECVHWVTATGKPGLAGDRQRVAADVDGPSEQGAGRPVCRQVHSRPYRGAITFENARGAFVELNSPREVFEVDSTDTRNLHEAPSVGIRDRCHRLAAIAWAFSGSCRARILSNLPASSDVLASTGPWPTRTARAYRPSPRRRWRSVDVDAAIAKMPRWGK
jgi:hypothetical protein